MGAVSPLPTRFRTGPEFTRSYIRNCQTISARIGSRIAKL